MKKDKKHCVVLFSGGLDSTTVLYQANQDFIVHAISFDYEQNHKYELSAAKKILEKLSIDNHKILTIDLRQFGNSALTDNIQVPKNRKMDEEIPITYVPVRNTIFLSYALAYAEVNNIFDIFIGVNALDYSGYPDCRPEFINAFQEMANFATKFSQGSQKIRIHTPLIHLKKSEIITKGLNLGVDYSLTHSCYDPIRGLPCRECDACILRINGFKELNLIDPILQ
jgi:7-cyano-7-deazaguanine synthase